MHGGATCYAATAPGADHAICRQSARARREFIKLSALASGMLLVPNFLHGLDRSGMQLLANSNGKRLVVVQMGGGNDGLNTVVPYQNDLYYRARPTLAIPPLKYLRLIKDSG